MVLKASLPFFFSIYFFLFLYPCDKIEERTRAINWINGLKIERKHFAPRHFFHATFTFSRILFCLLIFFFSLCVRRFDKIRPNLLYETSIELTNHFNPIWWWCFKCCRCFRLRFVAIRFQTGSTLIYKIYECESVLLLNWLHEPFVTKQTRLNWKQPKMW